MPTLDEDNVQAWEVFAICSSQMRVVGMGTPLGLEFAAIDRAMQIVGVHPLDRTHVFEKVRRLGEAYARQINDKAEADRNKREGKKTTKAQVQIPPMYTVEEMRAFENMPEDATEDDDDENLPPVIEEPTTTEETD